MYNKLTRYSKSEVYPLHMPGHKRRGFDCVNPYTIDITEIDGFDDLHDATGIIKDGEKRVAKLYGADESFFLVNGSTGGIISAISTCAKSGETLLMARNCHKSVYNGALVNKLNIDYIYPENYKGISLGIKPEDVLKHMQLDPRIKAVILTSPTYEGVVSDIEGIAKVVHENNGVLIVDEAHGAHFPFGETFPQSAIELGADIVIQSAHKTLPAFTQSGWIHVKGNRVDVDRLKEYLSIYQTSSPSYILMSSLDRCASFLENEGKAEFVKYQTLLKEIRNELSLLNRFELFGGLVKDREDVYDLDPGKLVILTNGVMTGVELAGILRNKYKLEVEMAGPGLIIAMTSVMDTKKGLLRFVKALKEIELSAEIKVETDNENADYSFPRAKVYMSAHTAFGSETKFVKLSEARNQVSGEFVICYPPGIPLVVPGEMLTPKMLETIVNFKALGVHLTGAADLINDRIKVVI